MKTNTEYQSPEMTVQFKTKARLKMVPKTVLCPYCETGHVGHQNLDAHLNKEHPGWASKAISSLERRIWTN